MKIGQKGLDLIKKKEGMALTPYICPAGIPTIGYGNTYYPDGRKVTMNDNAITEQDAENLLKHVLENYENGVNRYVQKPINQNQFDALVSFAYNLGLGALKESTLLKKVNSDPNDVDIAFQFSRWNKADGRALAGLTLRRKEEADLYFS